MFAYTHHLHMFHVIFFFVGIDYYYEWSTWLYYKYQVLSWLRNTDTSSIRKAAASNLFEQTFMATTVQGNNKLLLVHFLHSFMPSLIHCSSGIFGCSESGQSGFASCQLAKPYSKIQLKHFNTLRIRITSFISIGVYFHAKFCVWTEFLHWMDSAEFM